MIRVEARPQPSAVMAYATPVLAVVLTMIFGGILFAVLGKDPFQAIITIFWEPIFGEFAFFYRPQLLIKGAPLILGYHKYDMASGAKSSHQLTEGRTGSEASFVPAANGVDEDGGYLLSFVYDAAEGASELVILNAKAMEDEPLARIHLPVRVPAGFHGSWIADQV